MLNDNYNQEVIEDKYDLKKEIFKYLFFWRWFALSIIICLLASLFYLRYSHNIYSTSAKIKILDKKEGSLELPSASDLFSSNKINLENEIELLSSYTILSKVIQQENLNTNFYSVGDIMTARLVHLPFHFEQIISNDSIQEELEFEIYFNNEGVEINDINNDTNYLFNTYSTYTIPHALPFNIRWNKASALLRFDESFKVVFSTTKNTVSRLKNSLSLTKLGKESDIVLLKIENENLEYSEIILNTLINVFNNDGVSDRQMIHKRTIDFVNERYILLSNELDSIEIQKQLYKLQNNLIDITANSSLSLELSSKSNQQLLDLENQIAIAKLLDESFKNNNYDLLPANIGINNSKINFLITDFNTIILERKNLIISAGLNNPSVMQLDRAINDNRTNIIRTVNNYLIQLKQTKKQLTLQSKKLNKDVSNLPEKEKILRAIERNQAIKESLYLFLLQKREEAEVSFAVTEPTIKVIEYALSSDIPILPRKQIIFLIALLISLLIPFGVLYIFFLFDTKIHSREDIESHNSSLNVLGEIPFFDLMEAEKIFDDPSARSIVSESFRMLMSNTRYLFKDNNKSQVLLVTSSIKGEGKTLSALNLSLSFASLNKKVLLVGCDLRNPQIHKYLDEDKNQKGLVDFLVDNKSSWKENTLNNFDKIPNHHILLSGALPPNPLYLINNGNMEIFIDQAKKEFDYIIIDSAPTLLVADTKSLFGQADTIIYLTRCNVTDKEVLNHISSSTKESKCNISVVLNGVGEKNAYGYSYGYKYGYGYNYKYSYNYGYGYGYEEEKS